MTRGDRAMPAAPVGLSPEIAALWPGRFADLVAVTGASEIETARLADVMRLEDRLAKVRAKLDEQGETVTGSQGQVRPHPLIDVEVRLTKAIADGYRHLNLTPGPHDALNPVDRNGRLQPRR